MTLDEIRALSAYALADMAGAATPDSTDSQGAKFVIDVRDAFAEAVAYGRIGPDATEHTGDVAAEIADSAPSVYTYTRWQQFVDIGAWQEQPEFVDSWAEAGPELTDMAGVALYQIAARLVHALAAELDTDADAPDAQPWHAPHADAVTHGDADGAL